MTGWTRRALLAALPALSVAGGAAPAAAQAPADDGETGHLASDVDFSKPPSEVEGYNKARISVEREDTDDGVLFQVHGRAYYPDGVRFVVTLRYWKHVRMFGRIEAEVSDRAFSATLGPYADAIPRGELVAEAWFRLKRQTEAARGAMEEGDYFSCSPPCRYDRANVTRTRIDMGGDAGQERAERAEKVRLREALDALVAAREALRRALEGEEDAAAAEEAFARQEEDLDAGLEPLGRWLEGRLFALFPEQVAATRALAGSIRSEGRLRTALAGGLDLGGTTRAQTARSLAEAKGEVDAAVEELRGFLDEEGSLDRMWEELNEEAVERARRRRRDADGGDEER